MQTQHHSSIGQFIRGSILHRNDCDSKDMVFDALEITKDAYNSRGLRLGYSTRFSYDASYMGKKHASAGIFLFPNKPALTIELTFYKHEEFDYSNEYHYEAYVASINYFQYTDRMFGTSLTQCYIAALLHDVLDVNQIQEFNKVIAECCTNSVSLFHIKNNVDVVCCDAVEHGRRLRKIFCKMK